MSLSDWILGRALASQDAEENKVSVWGGIPILGLDALSSAAYGPEAALTLLIPLGIAGLTHMLPIVGIIVALLFILFISYRQTIAAYPNGGGSYIVAKGNLGTTAGLFAAAALMLDYILTVSVGISAGIGALISAVPGHHHHILALCLGTLAIITLVNLRGVRDSGLVFGMPTYLFIVSLIGVLAYGLIKALVAGGHPTPIEVPPTIPKATMDASLWLLMRSFASGCTAMTGVEAVSNGIQAFAKPAVPRAQQTLSAIVALLAIMLLAIAYLCNAYHVGAMDADSHAYQSVLSQLVAAIVGRGVVYYVTLGAIIAVLALSANTGFADFPRLCHLIADDSFLPHFFGIRGRRLVYSTGIVILALFCGILLTIFGGITDRLIPLYAIGAFLAFTLSQAGMVGHWLSHRDQKHWRTSLAINGFGAICTGIALAVVLVAKFLDGAWITVLLIPSLVTLFRKIHKHYAFVNKQIECQRPINPGELVRPIVVLPMKAWTEVSASALEFALELSHEVFVVHIVADDADEKLVREQWKKYVHDPLEKSKKPLPKLEVLSSPYRRFVGPILDKVKALRSQHPHRRIAVVIPELVETGAFEWLLHNQRASVLKAALLFSGDTNTVVINVPWYVKE